MTQGGVDRAKRVSATIVHSPGKLTPLRALAVLEAAKGLLVVLAGVGLLRWEDGPQRIAGMLITHLHLDPARHFTRIFTFLNSHSPSHMRWLAIGAAAYAAGRLIEAVGLWLDKPWAVWVAVWTAVIYIPFELHSLIRDPNPIALVALVINSAIVLYLLSNPALEGGLIRGRKRGPVDRT
jgi:uncharacterized membrane protein (DUF2068 family)